jgi:hypothetical protein
VEPKAVAAVTDSGVASAGYCIPQSSRVRSTVEIRPFQALSRKVGF